MSDLSSSAQQAADQRLLEQVVQGNQTAFATLYDRLSGPLYGLALRMLGDAAEAEDALQEALLTIWRRAPTYDPARSSVFGWAVFLTRSKIIDRLRARGRRLRVLISPAATDADEERREDPPDPASSAAGAADTLDKAEQAASIRRVLHTLPIEQRQAIELAFFSDLTHFEIAARLSQPLGTIKARIRRGLLKLRESLHGHHPSLSPEGNLADRPPL